MKKLIQYTKIAFLTIILAEEVRKAMRSNKNYFIGMSSEKFKTTINQFWMEN